MEIKEELLHHAWRYGYFKKPLLDLDDLPVELVDPGQFNRDSGPDFFNAKIRSGGILWAGNVEVHRKASEWYQHGHDKDPAFDNVVLHVVIDPDCQVKNSRGREIRTVKMEIPAEILTQYELFRHNPEWIPGWEAINVLDLSQKDTSLERLLYERLEERSARVRAELIRCAGEWEEVLFGFLARAFGQKVNADPFEMLARSVPLMRIQKFCPDILSKEAVLFGQAGMLAGNPLQLMAAGSQHDGRGNKVPGYHTEGRNPYYQELCQRYVFLQSKIGLQPIEGFLWKFLRLRPDNFPTVRISQLACLLENYPDLFRQLLDHPDPLGFVWEMEIKASAYWNTHYRFQRESPPKEKSMGLERRNGLFINAILPVLFAESLIRAKAHRVQELPKLLLRIPPEDNRIIRIWKSLGMIVPDGFSSQALLQLTKRGTLTL